MSHTQQVPERVQHNRRYLMCRPEHFTVSYSINPWMDPEEPTDTSLAVRQWQKLYDTYIELGHEVELIDPQPGLPDMVYTANGGFLIDGVAYPPKFRYEERQGEEPWFTQWFRDSGYEVSGPEFTNEGEGDFLLAGDVILAGRGFRSTDDSHRELETIFGREVVTLTLTDPRFYHLDTALSVLDPVVAPGQEPTIAYLPGAFDEASRAELERRFPNAIHVSDADGAVFGLNSASDGKHVFISPRATGFEKQLRERGYTPVLIDLSELLLGGGGIKCCTLELRGKSA
ncbi:dimethylargininase [Microbacterium amylolyticum]|uniref:N-dimethylarginine dimethylaminohydrolase n=1 Tax=Microbacterium amylolyticum TaxID=936337 RepID=A0ABS4ZHA8_9MICO|nr:dimethylargininase [Microbacterium amylolyticum]MBP2436657.1 N-dimethylarginine dimethylaminohydrolase [Microbacterium amylolyticum]